MAKKKVKNTGWVRKEIELETDEVRTLSKDYDQSYNATNYYRLIDDNTHQLGKTFNHNFTRN